MTTTTEAPKKKEKVTFAQQLAIRAAKIAKINEGLAKKLAKSDKETNPELAKAASALDTMQRALKLLGKFRVAAEMPTLSFEDCVEMLSQEMASAMPGLLAKIDEAS